MRRLASYTALTLLAWAVTAGATQKIELDFDPTKDLSRYRSFAWNAEQKPVENMANHVRLVNAIQKTMMELGYRIDPRNPDLYIQYFVERHTELQTSSTQRPSVWDPTNLRVEVDVRREDLVSLELQLKEADSNFLVWQHKGTYPIGTPDRSERQINEAVKDIFSHYPTGEDGKKDKKKK